MFFSFVELPSFALPFLFSASAASNEPSLILATSSSVALSWFVRRRFLFCSVARSALMESTRLLSWRFSTTRPVASRHSCVFLWSRLSFIGRN